MKRLTIIAGLFVALLVAGGLSQPAQAQEKVENPDIVVGVNGLSCPFCAYGVERKLTELDAVDQILVGIKKGIVQLTVKEGATLSEKQIRQAIDVAFDKSGTLYVVDFGNNRIQVFAPES